MQGTQVRSLTQEDPICLGATKPLRQLLSLCSRAHSLQLVKAYMQQQRPSITKNKQIKKLKKKEETTMKWVEVVEMQYSQNLYP